MIKTTVAVSLLLAAVVATAEIPEIVPSEGFKLFSPQTVNMDRDNPDTGSVTFYAEANPHMLRTRVWIRNDSDYWLSVSWVKVCIGVSSRINCRSTPRGLIDTNNMFAICLRDSAAPTCGGKDYYVPPGDVQSWQLDRQVWMGRGYREAQYVTYHVQWTKGVGAPRDRTGPVSCLCER